jgi:hypothetical protein
MSGLRIHAPMTARLSAMGLDIEGRHDPPGQLQLFASEAEELIIFGS